MFEESAKRREKAGKGGKTTAILRDRSGIELQKSGMPSAKCLRNQSRIFSKETESFCGFQIFNHENFPYPLKNGAKSLLVKVATEIFQKKSRCFSYFFFKKK